MKKIWSLAAVVSGMLLTLVLTALPALARSYPPQPPAEEEVIRGPAGAGVAFTGRDVTLLVALIGFLAIAGVVALIAARRRTAGAAG
jgi:hypothetical protein